MAPSTKTLSPAELQKLETAFASDPASEAYKPLAEAYLSMGRFMEAMVVCKKGVKAHPTLPDPRVLLARVYADQGKDKKALEELQSALQVSPTDKLALRLMGSLQMRGGDAENGRSNLLKAFDADPKDGDTLALLEQFKVELPKPPAPPPPPPAPPAPPPAPMSATAPVLTPVAAPPSASFNSLEIVEGTQNDLPPVVVAASPVQAPPPPPQARAPAAAQPPRLTAQPAAAPQPQRAPAAARPSAPKQAKPAPKPAPRVVEEDEEPISEEVEIPKAQAKAGASRAVFFLLLFLVPLAAGAYYAIGQWKAIRMREVKALLSRANDLLKTDTFASYKAACDAAEEALNKVPDSPIAHAYLAYAYTIRSGEHERDDAIRQRAEEHLKEAKEAKSSDQTFAHLLAAEALHKFYTGKGAEARAELEAIVKKLEADSKRPAMLQLTLGIIQMNQGDLEAAKDTLEHAQANAPDDPRVYVALGNLSRRRGNDGQALNNFNSALKYTKNSHPEGLLGTAILILDQDNPGQGYVTAARYVKTLLESDPPPSPRQLALGHAVRAYLVSRVSTDLPLFSDRAFQKTLEDGTGVTADSGKARSEIQKEEDQALALDRTNPELFLVRGKRLVFEKKFDEGAAEIRKAIELNGQMAHYHVELARALLKKQGGEKEAEDALRKALALVPGSPKLLSLFGQVLFRQRKVDEAVATLEKSVADPKLKNPEARYLLGRIYRDEKKDNDKAAALLEKAAAEYYSDASMAATVFDELGATYELKNDKDRARANYEKALNADREYAASYCHYARLLAKLGDPKDKDKQKDVAKEYLKLEPQGECAADMQRLAQ